MSQAVKVAMLATKDLRPNERLVLIAIAAHTNREGNAWPSVATIAEYSGVSPRTVHRVLSRLVAVGRVVVSKVAGIASNVYRLVVDAVTSTGPGTANPAGGTANQPGGSANDSGTVADEVVEDPSKLRGRAGALRRFLPGVKNNTPNPRRQQPQHSYPQRQGAALPPAPGGDRCQRPGHVGQLAGRCIPCRSEALAGGR